MGLNKRLQELIEEEGVTQYELAEKLQVPQSTISRIINSITTKPSERVLNALAYHFNVNPEWLQTGEGEKELNKVQILERENAILTETNRNLTETVKTLSETIKNLTSKQ